jgi:transcriptional regulator with XRE-family HTH domain
MAHVATMAPIIPVQCFLAREALGWTMSDLARAAGVSQSAVRKFERGGSQRATTVEAIQRALENAGVIFIDANDGGPGARLRKAE